MNISDLTPLGAIERIAQAVIDQDDNKIKHEVRTFMDEWFFHVYRPPAHLAPRSAYKQEHVLEVLSNITLTCHYLAEEAATQPDRPLHALVSYTTLQADLIDLLYTLGSLYISLIQDTAREIAHVLTDQGISQEEAERLLQEMPYKPMLDRCGVTPADVLTRMPA